MICIIMSTYNGEKYLEKQLDSIFMQNISCNELCLYVRDDGSIDNTIELLKSYKNINNVDIIVDAGENKGAADSFFDAIKKCPDAEYYAFCDQDDVWHQNKLKTAVEELGGVHGPALWCSNYDVVDSELNVLTPKAIQQARLNDRQALFFNNIPGCVMVFNQALMSELRKIEVSHIRMHDIMAINVALICGKVIFNSHSFIKYRQHQNNVIGYGHKKKNLVKWINEKLCVLIHKEKYSYSEYAKEILRLFGDIMCDEQLKDYSIIAGIDKSLLNRVRLLRKSYMKERLGRTSISIRTKILLGLFRRNNDA